MKRNSNVSLISFLGSGFRSTGRIALGFRSSGISKYWTNEIGSPRLPRTELVLRLGGSWTEFRGPGHHFEDSGISKSCERNWLERSRTLGSFRISIWDWDTGS
ncbi:unnamed protein product [Rhizophagus irregularis]|nr:unnamed protein product [Rhizophagus irregularis]